MPSLKRIESQIASLPEPELRQFRSWFYEFDAGCWDDERIKCKVREIGVHNLAISNAVLSELYYGAYNSTKIRTNLTTIDTFSKHLTIFSDSEPV